MYKSDEKIPLFRWNLFDNFSKDINCAVTWKSGGNNLALHTGDNRESVIQNRMDLCSSQNIPFENYTSAEQTHGSNIRIVSKVDRGKSRIDYSDSIKNTDALIVTIPGIMINIYLADCVPIVLYDYKKKIGSLVHGGWKGTAALITKKTISFMIEKLQCSSKTIIAGIGPSIGKCCFEIGQDTAEIINSSFSYSDLVIFKNKDLISADLKQANKEQILSMGIGENQIEISEICTSCRNDLFFSYRAESGNTGRFSTFLTLL